MKNNIFLSVIIPVYNESKRLHNLLKVFDFLKSRRFLSELIIVSDGSTDLTLSELNKLQKKYPFRVISYSKNQGKGYAIKKGILTASGKYRLFTDIDLSTPIEEFEKFEAFLPNFDVLIASRKQQQSKLIVQQSLVREILGKGFTFLSQIILRMQISDFTCGFKIFTRKAAGEIFPRLTIRRWGFDTEALFIAQTRNLKIKEIGVVWKNDPLTKVKFPHDIINSLKELISIRFNYLRGRYQ